MRTEAVSEAAWARLTGLIAQSIGLHFPPERQADLRRGLATAAVEFGFGNVSNCVEWLQSAALTKAQLSMLAGHLTVGETYFFRERKTFDALAASVLPQLLRRHESERCLRLWSAACSTGEEPYSLAIMVRELLHDRQDWQVMILATDINERFLHKAKAAIYSEWSFRGCPSELRQRYFTRTPDGRFSVVPEIKSCVTFAQMNLAQDELPSAGSHICGMDVILCRNLLIYFAPSQARKLVGRLRDALAGDGWLAVSACEYSQTLFPGFTAVNFPGSVLYQKCSAEITTATAAHTPLEVTSQPAPQVWNADRRSPAGTDASSVGNAAGGAAAVVSPPSQPDHRPSPVSAPVQEPRALSRLAQTMADQGELADALTWSKRWIAADKADPQAHYLQAIILLEQGEREGARRALQRATYLRPDFAVAYFALGNLARAAARTTEANRHFANALRLLRTRPCDELLPEFEGMTAGRLVQIITSVLAMSEQGHVANLE